MATPKQKTKKATKAKAPVKKPAPAKKVAVKKTTKVTPKPIDYTKIKTFDAVLKANGLTKADIADVENLYKRIAAKLPASRRANYVTFKVAEFEMELMCMTINGSWEPDWTNTDERKYYNWWWINKEKKSVSGCGLSLYDVSYDVSYSIVAPRLVFQDEQKCRHAAKYFKKLYEKYYFLK